MPASSTAKNPKGVSIVFFEDTHKYISVIDGREISYVSGSQLLGRYYPQFDPDGSIAQKCAAKEGISVEELKAKWKAKGDESCRLGTRLHETIEDVLLQRDQRNSPEDEDEELRFKNGKAAAQQFLQRLDILGVEKIVFSDQLGVAGTIDLLARSRKTGNIVIIDHKTNKEIAKDNPWHKFCLSPISHIPDIAFYHYSLQLSLYFYLLKREGYVPRSSTGDLFLNHVTPFKAQLIRIPYLEDEVQEIMIDYLSSERNCQ